MTDSTGSDSDSVQFTDKQRQILSRLPATGNEVANEIGVDPGIVRSRIQDIRNKAGFDAILHDNGVYYYNGEERAHRVTTRNKTTVTRKANEHLTDAEKHVKGLLKQTDPTSPIPEVDTAEESVVIHRSDDHLGQVVCDDSGREIFNVEIAESRVRAVTQRVMELVAREDTHREFDTCYLLLGGDTVTNENVYSHQPYNIEATLDEQIELATTLYYEQIEKLSRVFNDLIVVCQGGNHGEIRASGQSNDANADDIVYSNLDLMVRVSDLPNVHIRRNDATKFINFNIRGHRAHMRHGQDSLNHIGTSSGKNRWRGWKLQHEFDLAFRGHYHEWKIEHVMDAPVIMSGSVCPPGDFEESLSLWSQPAATIFGVSDKRPMTWFYPINFDGQHDISTRGDDPVFDV